jgi:hypothetical protein
MTTEKIEPSENATTYTLQTHGEQRVTFGDDIPVIVRERITIKVELGSAEWLLLVVALATYILVNA